MCIECIGRHRPGRKCQTQLVALLMIDCIVAEPPTFINLNTCKTNIISLHAGGNLKMGVAIDTIVSIAIAVGTLGAVTNRHPGLRTRLQTMQFKRFSITKLDFVPLAIHSEPRRYADRQVSCPHNFKPMYDAKTVQLLCVAVTRVGVKLLFGYKVVLQQQLTVLIRRLAGD